MADYLTTDTELKSIADAIRTKGGTSETLSYPDGFVSAIDNISSGGGETIYRTLEGMAYTANEKWSAFSSPESSFRSNMFRGAEELLSFEWDCAGRAGAQYVFFNCPKLQSVKLPKCSGMWLGNTHFFTNCPALKTIVLGSVGTPVTRMDAGGFNVSPELTIYVDASTIADIPSLITDNVPSKWGTGTTVIYRNSTTGEVIEA